MRRRPNSSGFQQRVLAAAATSLALASAVLLASDRLSPPNVPPPAPIALPTPDVRTLPNGLQVLVVERHSLPVLTLRLLVRAGAERDPAGLAGTAQFTAGLLNEGTEHLSAIKIAESIDGAGGTVDSSAGWDSSFLVLSVLADQAPLAFDLMADMTIHPAFLSAEVERARRQTLSALEVLRDDPGTLADTLTHQFVLAGTPYGHPADGSLDSVKRLRPEDLAAFHAREYTPSHSVLAVVGDITAASAMEQAARAFGGWAASAPSPAKSAFAPERKRPTLKALRPAPNVIPAQAGIHLLNVAERATAPATSDGQAENAAPRVLIVDKPDAVQTEIRVANAGIPWSSPDYVALTVANQILGGAASNRLFSDLRGQHGLTYGASSDLDCYVAGGTWIAKTSTRTPETAKAVHQVLDEMRRLRDRPISAEELQQAVNYLIGHQALDFETSDGVADQFLELMAHHLPLDTWAKFPAVLLRLTPADVWQATRRHLDPDKAAIVLVGNAAEFEREIRKLGPTRVIPIGQLDLGSPTLVR